MRSVKPCKQTVKSVVIGLSPRRAMLEYDTAAPTCRFPVIWVGWGHKASARRPTQPSDLVGEQPAWSPCRPRPVQNQFRSRTQGTRITRQPCQSRRWEDPGRALKRVGKRKHYPASSHFCPKLRFESSSDREARSNCRPWEEGDPTLESGAELLRHEGGHDQNPDNDGGGDDYAELHLREHVVLVFVARHWLSSRYYWQGGCLSKILAKGLQTSHRSPKMPRFAKRKKPGIPSRVPGIKGVAMFSGQMVSAKHTPHAQ